MGKVPSRVFIDELLRLKPSAFAMVSLPSAEEVAAFRAQGFHVCDSLLAADELEALRQHAMQVIDGRYETNRPPMNRNPSDPDDPTKRPADQAVDAAALHQVNNAYWADATLARMVTDERIGRIAATLAGVAGVRLWHDQLLFKPAVSQQRHDQPGPDGSAEREEGAPGAFRQEKRPADGSVTFHQDMGYWCVVPPAYCHDFVHAYRLPETYRHLRECISDERALTARIALEDEDEHNGVSRADLRSFTIP